MIEAVPFFLAHLTGDYLWQNNWMAQKKTLRWLPAFVHGFFYTLAYFFFLQPSWAALIIIGATHVVLDHYRLPKYFIWAVNQLAPKADRYPWSEAKNNGGYSPGTPPFMSTWLMIIVDNTMHLIINYLAIKGFG